MSAAPSTRVRILWKLAAVAFLAAAESPPVAAEVRQLGGCSAFVERGTLRVAGNDAPNVIAVVGTPAGVQVTCDGATVSHSGVDQVVVEAGDGDDQISTDNSDGLLSAVELQIFGNAAGDFWEHSFINEFGEGVFPELHSFDGGPGIDQVRLFAGSSADRIEIVPAPLPASAGVQVTDLATGTPVARVIVSDIALLSVESGGGDDEFHIGAVAGIHMKLSGGVGNDSGGLDVLLGNTGPDALIDWAGEFGHDEFKVIGSNADEHYRMIPLPDRERPDPHIRVTDPAGVVTADLFVRETEQIEIEAGDGHDRVDVLWDAVHMSGVGMLRTDLGDGHDTMTVDVLPVLVAPPGGDVQAVFYDVVAGQGDDQIAFQHAGGSWFDVAFTARLGTGHDQFRAVFVPPPDDDLPGPVGTRRLLIDVAAGKENDVVAFQNGTGGEFFEVAVEAELGVGDDQLEASGEMSLDARPGRGFDTARVTGNLLPFVTEFERVEGIEVPAR